MPLYNPGEPVFDQDTGDLVVDPTTGDAVVVVESGQWTDPVTGVVYQADDVVNALYYRINTYVGEVLRDASKGVDYHNVVFGMPIREDLIVDEVRATALDTPGVAALTDARLVSYNFGTRAASFFFRMRKRGGATVPSLVTISG